MVSTGIYTGTNTATDKQWKLIMILQCGYKDYSAVATRKLSCVFCFLAHTWNKSVDGKPIFMGRSKGQNYNTYLLKFWFQYPCLARNLSQNSSIVWVGFFFQWLIRTPKVVLKHGLFLSHFFFFTNASSFAHVKHKIKLPGKGSA